MYDKLHVRHTCFGLNRPLSIILPATLSLQVKYILELVKHITDILGTYGKVV
jgi:hypothetical protein